MSKLVVCEKTECQKVFEVGESSRRRFCSRSCSSTTPRHERLRQCQGCPKTFIATNNARRFCSKRCVWRNKKTTKRNDMNRKLKRYGLTYDDYLLMHDRQQGVCMICLQPEKTRNKRGKVINLAVDHCHSTNKVRGLICRPCNHMLGLCQDNIVVLGRMIEYLRKFGLRPEQQTLRSFVYFDEDPLT